MKPTAAKTVSVQLIHRNHMPRTVTCLLALLFAVAATCAQAKTYYWKPGATQGLWTDLSNWSTEGFDGAAATALPASTDELYGLASYNFDLGNQTRTIKKCYNDSNSTDSFSITLENGRLDITGELRCCRGTVDVNNGATLQMPANSTIYTGLYLGAAEADRFSVNINSGGSMTVLGTARFFNTKYNVANGGTLTFSPSTLRISTQSYACRTGIENEGTLNLPNGLSMGVFDNTTSGASFTLWQTSGTLNLGGAITANSIPGTFNVDFAGGTVNVTGNASFDVTAANVSGPVTFNVAEGKTLNTTSLAVDNTGSFTKAGPGFIAFPATAQAVTVSEGGVALNDGTYDLSAVTFASGTTVHLASFGGTINAGGYPASLTEYATFTADLTAAATGTTIFNSDDATLLQKVKDDLTSGVPTGLELTISGTQLLLETATSEANTFTTSGNIAEGSGWGGSVPDQGASVAISGENVVGTLPSGAALPAWASIEVKNGATLRIEANAVLPPITLNKNATLVIGNNAIDNNAEVTLNNLSGVCNIHGDEITIPTISVESGATLKVPGGMKFANVNILLEGTIATVATGGITFGYADNGSTTYIGFTANGGTLSITEGSSSTYDIDPIEFCCPTLGSTVVAVGDLVLNSAILPRTSGYTYMQGRMVGLHLGRNNPDGQAFNLVFNNTQWGTSGKLYICGGASFRLTNNSSFITYEHHTQWDRYAEISGNGQLYVGDGCEFRLNAFGNWGDRALIVNSTLVSHRSVVVEDGGIFETYRWSGNGNGTFSVSNGVYQIFEPYIVDNDQLKSTNVPFNGLHEVDIATNSVLTFTTRNQANGHGYFNDGADRVVALADVPITGGGSIALDNANVNAFGVVVKSGANTATGTASVVAPTGSEGATTLYFADGANWAGRVVAGNVALTNLTDGAAVNVDFGALDLAVDFPIRVWTDNGGSIVTNDMLNVGTYDNTNGGRLVPVSAASGETLAAEGKIVVGKISKDSPLPTVARGWSARTSDILGDDANYLLTLKPNSGMQIILR